MSNLRDRMLSGGTIKIEESGIESTQEDLSSKLVRMASRLNLRLDLESVLDAICQETALALNLPAVSLRLLDEKTDTLYYAADYGLPPERRALAHPIPRPVYEEYIQRMGTSLVLEDISKFPELPDAKRFIKLGIRSAVITSMLRERQLVGSLNIYSFTLRTFSPFELELLEGLAHQAALATANAILYSALQKEQQMRAELLQRLMTAQEEERKRIARELHDEASQSVTALVVGIQSARLALRGDTRHAEEHLQACQSIAGGMLENIYRLIEDLRPSVLDDLGLIPAIKSYGEQRLEPLGILFQVAADDAPGRLPPSIETGLFRIFQEAMTNVIRHAKCSRVTINLHENGDRVLFEIIDDGLGFDPGRAAFAQRRRGIGLKSIQERATMVGATMNVESAPDRGTLIQIYLPRLREECNDAEN